MLEKPIVHMHIPKTAGTSVRRAVERTVDGSLRIFPHFDERQYVNDDETLKFDRSKYDFYSGHFGYNTASKIGGDIFTVVRYPVDRYISTYYFWRQLFEQGIEVSSKTRLAAQFSLDEFVKIKDESFLVEEFLDRVTWQFAYGSLTEHRALLRARGGTDNSVYQLALQNLPKFKIIGVQENLDKFKSAISEMLGINFQIERENTTDIKNTRADIRIETLRRIQKWVSMDLELYQTIIFNDKILPRGKDDEIKNM